ncbi:MAG TPA: hypothetical protein GXX75_21595 [Clostridiales bacterium]|nr:hypothetical protein [Clostridiales bacterium]
MVINTLKHNYYVIHKLEENQELEALLCKEVTPQEGKDPDQRYRVIRLKNLPLTYQVLPFFMELLNSREFTDYYDCFSKDGCLHLVFLQQDYPLLVDKLERERCDLRERLEIGKKLLSRILMQNMPDFILYDALAKESLCVSPSLEVAFRYSLASLADYRTIGISQVRQRLVPVFLALFDYELQKEASVDIEEFIEGLRIRDYRSYVDIYREYDGLYGRLVSGGLIAKIKPRTFLFRLWDRIKSLFKYMKAVVAALLLIAIAAYLIYTIYNQPVDTATVFNYNQIGTVWIEE